MWSHYLNQCKVIVNQNPGNKLQWNWNQNRKIFIQEYALENVVCKTSAISFRVQCVNTLRPSDTIWWHRIWSTLGQVMACCLTAPSHYLNQCWLIISEVKWPSTKGNFTKRHLSHQWLKWALHFHSNIPGFNELSNIISGGERGNDIDLVG